MLRTRPGEVFAKLVEGACHDTIGGVEGLFDAVAMVAIDVDVEYAGDGAEHLEDGQDNVVDIAESGRFALLCVM